MSRKRSVSAERILEMYGRNLSQRTIGRLLGIDRSTVYYYLKLYGVPTPKECRAINKRKIQQEHEALVDAVRRRDQEIVRMYVVENISGHEIGRRIGMSHSNVHRILTHADVKCRIGRPRKDQRPLPREIRIEPQPVVEKMLQLSQSRRA